MKKGPAATAVASSSSNSGAKKSGVSSGNAPAVDPAEAAAKAVFSGAHPRLVLCVLGQNKKDAVDVQTTKLERNEVAPSPTTTKDETVTTTAATSSSDAGLLALLRPFAAGAGIPLTLWEVPSLESVAAAASAKASTNNSSSKNSSSVPTALKEDQPLIIPTGTSGHDQKMKAPMNNKNEDTTANKNKENTSSASGSASLLPLQILSQMLSRHTMAATEAALPVLLAVDRSELCDVLRGPAQIREQGEDFIARFGEYLKRGNNKNNNRQHSGGGKNGSSPAASSAAVFTRSSDGSTGTIDVAKLVKMGQDLMRKGEAVYAEKMFAKALGVLDAVDHDGSMDDPNMDGSIAMTLGWLALAQMVQQPPEVEEEKKESVNGEKKTKQQLLQQQQQGHRRWEEHCRRLEQRYSAWAEPLSEASRALTMAKLLRLLPRGLRWTAASCSLKRLTEDASSPLKNPATASLPAAADARCLLVLTLFLAGDLERFITEALKLHLIHKEEFGHVALDALVAFCGEEHPLVVASGWLQLRTKN